MKRLLVQVTVIIFSIILISQFITGCISFKPIVGKWQNTETQDIVEFTRDGKVIVEVDSSIMTGTYELIGDDVVKLRLEGWGALVTAFGVDTWRYEISGNTMTVQIGGDTVTFIRK